MVRTHAVGQQLAELSCQSLPQAWHCLGRPLKPSSLSLPQSGMSPKLREPLGHNAFLAPLGKWQATTPCKPYLYLAVFLFFFWAVNEKSNKKEEVQTRITNIFHVFLP